MVSLTPPDAGRDISSAQTPLSSAHQKLYYLNTYSALARLGLGSTRGFGEGWPDKMGIVVAVKPRWRLLLVSRLKAHHEVNMG